jgi:hypothetical protein
LLHHHEHDKPLSEAERDRLLRAGATTRGTVMHCEPSAADRRRTQVRVFVQLKGGPSVEFSQELASLYQPAQGSPAAQRLAEVRGAEQLRHPDRIPKIQLPLFGGEQIPVRYDAADPRRAVIDVPALEKKALDDYIGREKKQKNPQAARGGARSGPPWVVPAHCPNCGAPVDQATASPAADPHCPFCSQPVPVSPLART